FDVYNNASQTFGEISKPVTDLYDSASTWLTENVVEPFNAGFDNMFGNFGSGGGVNPAQIAVDSPVKQSAIGGAIDQLKTNLMNSAYEVLNSISPELANSVFVNGGFSTVAFTESAKQILETLNTAFMIYSIARLIGHIIFACKQEEYE